MLKISLVLSCVAYVGHGRRLRLATTLQQSGPQAKHKEPPMSSGKDGKGKVSPALLLAKFLLACNPAALFSPAGIPTPAPSKADGNFLWGFQAVDGVHVQNKICRNVAVVCADDEQEMVCDLPEESLPPSFAELLKFTVSAMPIYVSPVLLSLIDTAIVGQISSEQLAALGPACGICDALTALMVFISVGTTNSVATSLGSLDVQAAKRVASVSVMMSFAIGSVVALLLRASIGVLISNMLAPAAVVSTISQTGGDVAAVAATGQLWAWCESYVKIRALSFPAALVLMSAQASCLGAKDSTSPTLAILLASVVNVVGDVILVLGPLSMGIAGAAWATVGCQFVAAAMLLRTLWKKCLIDLEELRIVPSSQELKRFFAFGAFIFVLISKQVVVNQPILLASMLGTAAGAAHQCLYSLFRVCCTLGDVTGATAQSFLPRYYVTDEDTGEVTFDATAARSTIKNILSMTALVGACNTAITFAVPLFKPGLFTQDARVVRLMRHAAPLAAGGLLMHPMILAIEGCLLATKDISWLVTVYLAIGVSSVLFTQLLLKFSPFRSLLSLNTIWVYLASFQLIRLFAFVWRLLFKTIGRTSLKGDSTSAVN